MRKILLALLVAMTAICLVATVSCGSGTIDSTSGISSESVSGDDSSDSGSKESTEPLYAPKITLNEDYSVSWEEVDGASAYTVNLNGADLDIKTTLCSVAKYTDVGEYKIKVKAIRETEETAYSNEVCYSIFKVGFPISSSCEFTGDEIVYSGSDYTFAVKEISDKYDYATMKIFVNGERKSVKDGMVSVANVTQNLIVTVEEPDELPIYTVTRINGDGYEIVGEDYAVKGKPYVFSVNFDSGVVIEKAVVFAGGNIVTPENGVYTVKRPKKDFEIEVCYVSFEGTPDNTIYLADTWKDISPIVSHGKITVSESSFALPVDWVTNLIGSGYTHLKFKAVAEGSKQISVASEGNVLRSADGTNADEFVFRIDLSNVTSYDITITAENAEKITLGEFKVYKYGEEWEKTDPLAYVCEEDGELIIDTYGCGGVAVYKDDSVYVEGGSNAVIVDENRSVRYVYAATSSVFTVDETEFYAVASENSGTRQIKVMVLKDGGEGRTVIRLKKSLEYAKTSPFVTLSFNSQRGETVKYVYGDLTVDKKTYNVFEKTEFACDITTEAYKTTAFGFYADRSDAGVVITATFAENTLENEFLTSKVWKKLNGGSAVIENGRICISGSWQTEMNLDWLKSLKAAGYKTLEFDARLVSDCYFQSQWKGKQEYFKADGKGVAHVTLDLTDENVLAICVNFRGKTKDGTAYGESICSFDVEYYNVIVK